MGLLGSVLLSVWIGCEDQSKEALEASGFLEAEEIRVSAEIPGRLLKILVPEGQRVRAGQVIALLDSNDYILQLRQAEAALKLAQARLDLLRKGAREEEIAMAERQAAQAQAALEQARKNFQRIQNLFQQKSVSKQILDQAQATLDIAEAQYETAALRLSLLRKGARREELDAVEAQYEQAKAARDLAQRQANKTKIRAPISGIVTSWVARQGELVAPGFPIATIADLNTLLVKVYLSEVNVARIRLDQAVFVKIDAFPKRKFEGRVAYISPEAEFTPKNIQTREERVKLVFEVKIEVKNPHGILKAGLPADVFFP